MGHRLSKIYTRTGDKGNTGLADGSRISKTSLRIELLGTIDELNSALGLVIAHGEHSSLVPQETSTSDTDNEQSRAIQDMLLGIQHDLFDIGSELCVPNQITISEQRVTLLEQQLDKLNDTLPWLKEFILPGGNISAAQCHLARSIARRAERVMAALSEEQSINPATFAYLNRLSDLLFVIARCLARTDGGKEVFWHNKNNGD